jgi:hypothetical protein
VYVTQEAIVPQVSDKFSTNDFKIYLYNSPTSITQKVTANDKNIPIILAYKDGEKVKYAAIIPVVVEH